MLYDDLDEIKLLCYKIFGCDAILMLGILLLTDTGGNIPAFYGLFMIFGALSAIVLLIIHWMKEFHVTIKRIKVPLSIVILPSILSLYFNSAIIKNPYWLMCFMFVMFILLLIWWNKQLKKLPDTLRMIDPRLEERYPDLGRKDLGRISDTKFFMSVSEALEQIAEEKIDSRLQNAVIDWYSVYISAPLALEGICMAMCTWMLVTIFLS